MCNLEGYKWASNGVLCHSLVLPLNSYIACHSSLNYQVLGHSNDQKTCGTYIPCLYENLTEG